MFRPALVDALRFARDADQRWLEAFLSSRSALVRRAAVAACADRPALTAAVSVRLDDVDALVGLEARRTLLSLGVESPPARLPAPRDLADPDDAVLALELLHRTDPARAAQSCREIPLTGDARVVSAALSFLAVSGDASAAAHVVTALAQRPDVAPAAWIALGLAGGAASQDAIIARVQRPWQLPEQASDLAALCQAALLVTGARVLPDIDEHEPDAAAVDRFRQRALAAWGAAAAAVRQAWRCRRGRPVSAAALAADLVAPGHPRRDLCQLELAARFGCKVPLDLRGPLARAGAAAERIAAWATGAASA